MGLFEDLGLIAPVTQVPLGIFDFFQAQQIADERARERQLGFDSISELERSIQGRIPTLGFDGQAFGGGADSFRSSGILGPNNTVGFGSFTGTPFNLNQGNEQFSGPDIFNVSSRADIEQEQLGNLGLAGVSPEDRFGTLSDTLLDPFAFDDQESGIRTNAQAGFERGQSTRDAELRELNTTADQSRDVLRANLRGDFQGEEGLKLPDADEIFRRTQQTGTRDALAREQTSIQSGLSRQEDLGRLGFDAFDGSSIFGVQRDALNQRLGDIQGVNLEAEAARTTTLSENAGERGKLFSDNQATNRGIFGDIGALERALLGEVGATGRTFLGLDEGRNSELNAALEALNERRTSTQQGISSGVFDFLANLPQQTLQTQQGQLGNQGEALANILASLGPEFDITQMLLALIGNREDILPTAAGIPDPLRGIGSDLEGFNDPAALIFGGTQ